MFWVVGIITSARDYPEIEFLYHVCHKHLRPTQQMTDTQSFSFEFFPLSALTLLSERVFRFRVEKKIKVVGWLYPPNYFLKVAPFPTFWDCVKVLLHLHSMPRVLTTKRRYDLELDVLPLLAAWSILNLSLLVVLLCSFKQWGFPCSDGYSEVQWNYDNCGCPRRPVQLVPRVLRCRAWMGGQLRRVPRLGLLYHCACEIWSSSGRYRWRHCGYPSSSSLADQWGRQRVSFFYSFKEAFRMTTESDFGSPLRLWDHW